MLSFQNQKTIATPSPFSTKLILSGNTKIVLTPTQTLKPNHGTFNSLTNYISLSLLMALFVFFLS